VLMHMAMRHCAQCGTPAETGPEAGVLCVMCANEQEMDEEWMALLED